MASDMAYRRAMNAVDIVDTINSATMADIFIAVFGMAIIMSVTSVAISVIIKRNIMYTPFIMFLEFIVLAVVLGFGTLILNIMHIASTLP